MISDKDKERLKNAILRTPVFQRLFFQGYDADIEIDDVSDPDMTRVLVNIKTKTRH